MFKNLLITSLLFLSTIILSAQISADDIAKIQSVGSIQINNEGYLVVYTLRVPADPKKENKASSNHLYLWNATTKTSSPLITGEGSVRGVKFRPEHNSITFLKKGKDDENSDLYEIVLESGRPIKIMDHVNSIISYNWSPNGEKIAFTALEVKKEQSTMLPYEPEIYEANLAFTRAYVRTIGTDNLLELDIEGQLSNLSWSPNGKFLALMSAPTPLVDDYYMSQTIKIADATSGKLITSIPHQGKKTMISWSPNSKKIAFIAGANINDPIAGRIFVSSIKEGKFKNLKPDFKGKFEKIYWSDDNKLLFLASESVYSSVGYINSNGENFKRIIESKDPVISYISVSPNGNVALLASSPSHPKELYFLSSWSSSPERITNSNTWLDKKSLAKQEKVIYKANDGTEIHGVLVRPLGEVKGEKYPLIVHVHGGPEAHVSNAWVTGYALPGQMGATEGFFVFYPNYRGSTGRGHEFIIMGHDDAAGKEFDDIVDGVDYLIDQGWVDKNKVGVMGGSYGGYATGWMATKFTDKFAAGVMFVGISNKISKWGTTDIPKEEYLVHARKWIWEDYDFFLKRSPIYYAGQSKTPLLIMHGANDTRVHPSQSMELYRHIKVRTETPVKLVFYTGEGHGNRKATAQYDYNLRYMRWFHKYLQGKDVDTDAPILLKK